MLTLTPKANNKYYEINKQLAKDIANGKKDSRLLDLLNTIHDKYKAVQLYPKTGKEIKKGVRVVDLIDGWAMMYSPEENMIKILDFIKTETSNIV